MRDFGERLKDARLIAGMSRDILVKEMNDTVSKNTIIRFEKGLSNPDTTTLYQLADVLKVRPNFFFERNKVSSSKVEFRKQSSLGQKKVNSIKQKVIENINKYVELEEILQIPSKFFNPIADYFVKSFPDIEDVTNQLRIHWGLGDKPLVNIVGMLENNEIKVIELDEDPNFDGLSGWANDIIPFLVINKNFLVERKRFTTLHELGHLLLNFPNNISKKNRENLCHAFAGSMLIPCNVFVEKLKSMDLIKIKEKYGISIQAIFSRAMTLGEIDSNRYVEFRKVISKDLKEESLGKYQVIESSDRFKQLVYEATSEGLISMSKASYYLNEKLAEFRDHFDTV